MIADTDKRLGTAVQELRDLIVGSTSSPPLFHPHVGSLSSFPAFCYPSPLQIQSKADPALSEAQELLNAEEEMEAATI